MRGPRTTRFALAPRWWPGHLAVVLALVVCGWLGWWQVQSFAHDAPAASSPGPVPVVPLDELTEPGSRLAAEDVGRRVRVEGTWEGERQLLVPGRVVEGRTGSLVVTPLRTALGVLPVVRGWVAGTRAPRPPSAPVRVIGLLQQSETEADATVVPGSLARDRLAYVATVTLLERLPYDDEELYDGFVALRAQDPPAAVALTPVPAAGPADDGRNEVGRWRNLGYGLQWWLFGGAAVFFWGAVLRRAEREQRPSPVPAADAGERTPAAQR